MTDPSMLRLQIQKRGVTKGRDHRLDYDLVKLMVGEFGKPPASPR